MDRERSDKIYEDIEDKYARLKQQALKEIEENGNPKELGDPASELENEFLTGSRYIQTPLKNGSAVEQMQKKREEFREILKNFGVSHDTAAQLSHVLGRLKLERATPAEGKLAQAIVTFQELRGLAIEEIKASGSLDKSKAPEELVDRAISEARERITKIREIIQKRVSDKEGITEGAPQRLDARLQGLFTNNQVSADTAERIVGILITIDQLMLQLKPPDKVN